jgi:hypothetical protein
MVGNADVRDRPVQGRCQEKPSRSSCLSHPVVFRISYRSRGTRSIQEEALSDLSNYLAIDECVPEQVRLGPSRRHRDNCAVQ